MKTFFTLITGASQGLGKSIALELAQKEMNLVLVALPNSGLNELCTFLSTNYQIEVYCIEVDLSITDSYYKIKEFIDSNRIQIKYLVNNAGVLSRGLFVDLDDKYVIDQIEVNVTAPTVLIKLLLPNLKQNTPAGILNVSSLAGMFSLPKKQVYGATKAYLLSFSKSLRKELKRDKITVTTVCPGGLNTTTKLCYQNRILGFMARHSTLCPEKAASVALKAMLKGRKLSIPGFINKCFRTLDKLIPEFIQDQITRSEIEKLESVV